MNAALSHVDYGSCRSEILRHLELANEWRTTWWWVSLQQQQHSETCCLENLNGTANVWQKWSSSLEGKTGIHWWINSKQLGPLVASNCFGNNETETKRWTERDKEHRRQTPEYDMSCTVNGILHRRASLVRNGITACIRKNDIAIRGESLKAKSRHTPDGSESSENASIPKREEFREFKSSHRSWEQPLHTLSCNVPVEVKTGEGKEFPWADWVFPLLTYWLPDSLIHWTTHTDTHEHAHRNTQTHAHTETHRHTHTDTQPTHTRTHTQAHSRYSLTHSLRQSVGQWVGQSVNRSLTPLFPDSCNSIQLNSITRSNTNVVDSVHTCSSAFVKTILM